MITKAEITQLSNESGMYFNLINEPYHYLGVWTDKNSYINILFEGRGILTFIQFKNKKQKEKYIKEHPDFKIVYETFGYKNLNSK